MGLTHSWYRPTELPANEFAAAVANIRIALKKLSVPLGGFEGVGEPILRPDAVVFNGVGAAACEPFEIQLIEFDRRGRPEKFSFCKTLGLPYDRAVRVALVVLKHHLGDRIKVTSDADDEAWQDARLAVQSACGFGTEFRLDPNE